MSNPKCPVTGKHCYTRAIAKAEARRQGSRTPGYLSAYKCPHASEHPAGAGLFHIGHTPSKRRRRRRGKKGRRR